MPKTYNIAGIEFTMQPNDLHRLNEAAPLVAKLRKLNFEFMQGIDMTVVKQYRQDIAAKEIVMEKIKLILETGKDEHGNSITPEEKVEYTKQLETLETNHKKLLEDFENDYNAQALIDLETEMYNYAFLKVISDVDFIKPIMKGILSPASAIDKIDLTTIETAQFIKEVISDFFGIMKRVNQPSVN